MQTLIISKSQASRLLNMSELVEETKAAYIEYSKNKFIQPSRAVSKVDASSIVINFPGTLENYPFFTVKVNVKTPSNAALGLPFLMGSILLIDRKTGHLLAVFESSLITAMRTGAAGAVGISAFVKDLSMNIAVIGAGVQGEWQIRALHAIGYVPTVYIYDIASDKSEILASKLRTELNLACHIVESSEQAVRQAKVVILTTQSQEPILTDKLLKPGMHINAFGADQPGKVELSASVIRNSTVVVDDINLSFTDGALNVAYTKKEITKDCVTCEIGELLSGKCKITETKPTVFANVGLAFQDAIACMLIYKKALKMNIGTWVDMEGHGHQEDTRPKMRAKL